MKRLLKIAWESVHLVCLGLIIYWAYSGEKWAAVLLGVLVFMWFIAAQLWEHNSEEWKKLSKDWQKLYERANDRYSR